MNRLLAALLVAALVVVLGPFTDFARVPWPPPTAPPVATSSSTLTVLVRGSAGSALGGAEVRAYHEGADGRFHDVGRAVTDEQGQAVLAGLPAGPAWVVAGAPGHARRERRLLLDGEARALELGLGVAHALTVRVEDERGTPLEGATVLVEGGALPHGALTQGGGAARFTALDAAPWALLVAARGHETARRRDVTGDVTITLRRLATLVVRVERPEPGTGGGTPAAGAEVFIAGAALWPARRATTGADGVVRITGLVPGAYDLRATLGELVTPTLLGALVEHGSETTLTLRLEPGRSVVAWVTSGEDDDAPPVVGAEVTLAEDGLSPFPLRGRTGADGRVTLGPLPRSAATLMARAEGHVASGAVAVPDPLEGPVRVPLLPGGTLHGTVVDARGRGVEACALEVVGTDRHGFPIAETALTQAFRATHFDWAAGGPSPLLPAGELGVMPGPVPPIPRAGAFGGVDGAGAVATLGALGVPPLVLPTTAEAWATRADGSFRIHPVTPGRVRLFVRHPDYVAGVSALVVLGPGGQAEVHVVLLVGAEVEGRVVDHRGHPVDGARVDVAALTTAQARSVITAPDGSFTLGAVPSEVAISVARPEEPERFVLRRALTFGEGERVRLELELPAPREHVALAVRDEDGKPVALAQITAQSLDAEVPLRRTVFTGEEGTAEVEDAAGLPLRLVVEAPGYLPLSQQVQHDRVELVLRRGVTVEGRVTAVSGRRAVEGADVVVESGARRHAVLTDAEGRYRVSDVTPGPVTVWASHPERARMQLTVTLERPTRSDRVVTLPDLDLPEGGAVSGLVQDQEGRPVAGARVSTSELPAYLPRGTLAPDVTRTDAKGRFKLTNLAPGAAVLRAYSPEAGRGTLAVSVVADREQGDLTVHLVRQGEDDEPVAPASVAVTLAERGTGDDRVLFVKLVARGSEAERAGVKEGDVLWEIDGIEPSSLGDARTRLSGATTEDVLLVLERDGAELKLRVPREPVGR